MNHGEPLERSNWQPWVWGNWHDVQRLDRYPGEVPPAEFEEAFCFEANRPKEMAEITSPEPRSNPVHFTCRSNRSRQRKEESVR